MRVYIYVCVCVVNKHDDHGEFDEESLRAHEEVTKVKNVEAIIIGKYEMETWSGFGFALPSPCLNTTRFWLWFLFHFFTVCFVLSCVVVCFVSARRCYLTSRCFVNAQVL